MIARLAALPARAWFAYPAVLVVQGRALWGIWHHELTGGDAFSYWSYAQHWVDDRTLSLLWSPLYNVYLGALRWLTGGDAVATEVWQRLVLALATTAFVLALARRLLPPAAALAVALWWAVLPVNFDSYFAVHLFAVPFLAGAGLLLTGEPSTRRQGWALALLLFAALFVRNELLWAALPVAAAIAYVAVRRRRLDVAALAVPLLVLALVTGLGYWRGYQHDGRLVSLWHAKERLNLCQAYATNYQQRHPGRFTANPFLACRPLIKQAFGTERASYGTAWKENPKAMAAFAAWNARHLPNGLELGLFDATSSRRNFDTFPQRVDHRYTDVLGAGLLLLLLVGLREASLRERLRRERWAWVGLAGATLSGLVATIFLARASPAYMYGASLSLMLLAGLAAAVLVRRRTESRLPAAAVALLPLVLLFAVPTHYRDRPTPLSDIYRGIRPLAGQLDDRVVVVPQRSVEAWGYLRTPPHRHFHWLDYLRVLPLTSQAKSLPSVLTELHASGLYVDAALAARPDVTLLLAAPRRFGWRVARHGGTGSDRWALLVRPPVGPG